MVLNAGWFGLRFELLTYRHRDPLTKLTVTSFLSLSLSSPPFPFPSGSVGMTVTLNAKLSEEDELRRLATNRN